MKIEYKKIYIVKTICVIPARKFRFQFSFYKIQFENLLSSSLRGILIIVMFQLYRQNKRLGWRKIIWFLSIYKHFVLSTNVLKLVRNQCYPREYHVNITWSFEWPVKMHCSIVHRIVTKYTQQNIDWSAFVYEVTLVKTVR